MKLRILFTCLIMAMFTGCLSEEDILESVLGEAPNVPAGTYSAECNNDGTDSSQLILTLTATTRSVVEMTHLGALDCSTAGSAGTPDDAAIAFSDQSLGDDISYIEEAGEFIPFQYKDGVLILGFAVADASDPSVFAAFVEDPEGNAEIIFTLQ